MSPPSSEDERHRLSVLKSLQGLPPDTEGFLDRMTRVARNVCECSLAAVSFVDSDRVRLQASSGGSAPQLSRSSALCSDVIEEEDVIVVDDLEPGPPYDGLRFYAGAPITVRGATVGTFLVMDSEPRSFTPSNRQVLSDLAQAVARHLEARQNSAEVDYLRSALEAARDAVVITEAQPLDPPGPRIIWANNAFARMTGYDLEELIGATPRILQGPETSRSVLNKVRSALENERPVHAETVNYRADGTPYVVSWHIAPVHDDNGNLTHWVSVQRDVTDRERREERLRHEATHDSLTGLPNRYAIKEKIESLTTWAPDRSASALLYVDLDQFKPVNDNHGHHVGDQVLMHTADILREALRAHDVIGRIGGDEFVVCLSGLNSPDEAHHVAQRLQDALTTSFEIGTHEIQIGASIGGTTGVSNYSSAGEALHVADQAMYEAKERGDNQPVIRNQSAHADGESRVHSTAS